MKFNVIKKELYVVGFIVTVDANDEEEAIKKVSDGEGEEFFEDNVRYLLDKEVRGEYLADLPPEGWDVDGYEE